MPLVRFMPIRSLVGWPTCGLLGSPLSSCHPPVSNRATGCREANRPLSLTSGSSSLETTPLQSSNDFNHRPHTFRGGQPAWGFGPLRDITEARSLVAEHPTFRYVPPSGFLSLSTVCPTLRLMGLFHPTATFRVRTRSGASPSTQPPSLIGRSCPLAVRTPLAPRPKPAATNEAPRLRGLHPCRGSCLRFGVTRPVGRSPPQVRAHPG
jgi:hypothetical protein